MERGAGTGNEIRVSSIPTLLPFQEKPWVTIPAGRNQLSIPGINDFVEVITNFF